MVARPRAIVPLLAIPQDRVATQDGDLELLSQELCRFLKVSPDLCICAKQVLKVSANRAGGGVDIRRARQGIADKRKKTEDLS